MTSKPAALRKLVEYGVTEGQKSADSLGYIPLPENVKQAVLARTAKFIQ